MRQQENKADQYGETSLKRSEIPKTLVKTNCNFWLNEMWSVSFIIICVENRTNKLVKVVLKWPKIVKKGRKGSNAAVVNNQTFAYLPTYPKPPK